MILSNDTSYLPLLSLNRVQSFGFLPTRVNNFYFIFSINKTYFKNYFRPKKYYKNIILFIYRILGYIYNYNSVFKYKKRNFREQYSLTFTVNIHALFKVIDFFNLYEY